MILKLQSKYGEQGTFLPAPKIVIVEFVGEGNESILETALSSNEESHGRSILHFGYHVEEAKKVESRKPFIGAVIHLLVRPNFGDPYFCPICCLVVSHCAEISQQH
ncbi:hypothetical protein PIB30_072773 [Stylosanthes scabra]|uniref:Uncharacterized protein n=1 Tax=Stylosanthes scabra TaxID=79078 RepID=A0ABU6XP64_9FABA|nr:hypothetical protein [Stylosanthes scabra]